MAYMPYTKNPYMPRVRMEAVNCVRVGWSIRQAARRYGVEPSTVLRWIRKAGHSNLRVIPTESSHPYSHPRELAPEMVSRILVMRSERNQCAEILHHRLASEGAMVSLSSVKRVLKRHGVSRFSKWKKWHQYPLRPMPEKPGILVQIDTIHDGPHDDRLYAYASIDVCSRWAYAAPSLKINTHRSLRFVEGARNAAPFVFRTVQSDHGAEFSKWFTKRISERGLAHRHSRVRTPTDNSHVERFIQTLQKDCLVRIPRTLRSWQREIPEFLHYYNTERPHMGLNYRAPLEVLRRY